MAFWVALVLLDDSFVSVGLNGDVSTIHFSIPVGVFDNRSIYAEGSGCHFYVFLRGLSDGTATHGFEQIT